MKNKWISTLLTASILLGSHSLLAAEGLQETLTNEIILVLDSKTALVNGQAYPLLSAPKVIEGRTFLPLRFVADQILGAEVNWNNNTREVTVIKGNKTVVLKIGEKTATINGEKVEIDKPPVIENNVTLLPIRFMSETFGVQTNYNEMNRAITLFSTGPILMINPNQKPVITHLAAHKDDYAQGEGIALTYNYQNEAWKKIKAERWTYRRADEPISKAVIDKPNALFAEGDYIVGLQLEDTYGNMSDRKEIIIHISKEVIRTELEYKFAEGNIGDIIDNFQRFNYRSYGEIFPYETSTQQGTVIMSDSPELVKQAGILYKGNINGAGRILLHHISEVPVSGSGSDYKRLVLVAENTSDQPVRVRIENKTIKGPSPDTLYIGQMLLLDYLKGTGYEEHILVPGQKKYIYDSGTRKWLKGQTISGLMDVVTDGEITFTVAAVDQKNTIESIANMPLLQKDIHPRGTFDVTDIHYTVHLGEGEAEALIIGKGSEEWVNGYDELTGESVQNRGNFGISYHIKITAKQDMGIILNPRGDIFRGAIKWEGQNPHLIPKKGFFAGDTAKSVILGTIKAGETKTFEYMLPNGSSAPVLIGFIPKHAW